MSLGRVLVVDDEPEVRQLLQEFLSGRGYEVLVAGDGMAALDALDVQRPDLVLLDVAMPEMDGVEALKRIVMIDPPVPVIMVTANADISLTSKLLAMGAVDYIPKPFDLDYLEQAVSIQLAAARSRERRRVKSRHCRIRGSGGSELRARGPAWPLNACTAATTGPWARKRASPSKSCDVSVSPQAEGVGNFQFLRRCSPRCPNLMGAINGNILAMLRRGRGYRDHEYLVLKSRRRPRPDVSVGSHKYRARYDEQTAKTIASMVIYAWV